VIVARDPPGLHHPIGVNAAGPAAVERSAGPRRSPTLGEHLVLHGIRLRSSPTARGRGITSWG
jgi:hypothetical protein